MTANKRPATKSKPTKRPARKSPYTGPFSKYDTVGRVVAAIMIAIALVSVVVTLGPAVMGMFREPKAVTGSFMVDGGMVISKGGTVQIPLYGESGKNTGCWLNYPEMAHFNPTIHCPKHHHPSDNAADALNHAEARKHGATP